MRPLLVLATDSPEPSGLGEHMLALGTSLQAEFEVVIACVDSEGGQKLLGRAGKAGLRIKSIDLGQLPGFGQWLKSSGGALLHIHAGIGWEGHALVRAGKAAGLKVVRTEHLPYLLTSAVQQAAYRAILMSVDRVIAVSQAVLDSYVDRHTPKQFSMVANGITARASTRARNEVRASLGIVQHESLMLTVARFTPQKGYPDLLAAIPAVLSSQPRARFIFVGDGPDRDDIEERIEALNLTAAVDVLGQRNDVTELLAAADGFVLPSLFEGLPLALLEAMATGTPVVATAIGGSIEALGEAHPFLVPPGNPSALAAAIVGIIENADLAASSATSARERFVSHFGAARMARETAAVYSRVLGTPNISARP